MNKLFIILGIIVIIGLVGFLAYNSFIKKELSFICGTPYLKQEFPMEKKFAGKKIVMVVAYRDFRDEEYFVPKEVLKESGIEVQTGSNQKGTAIGAGGGEAEVDLLVSEINLADFDAVVFVGGPGAVKYLDNEESYRVAKETVSQDKVLGTICIASTILAKAGVLEGKRATVWTSPLDKSAVKILEDNGAEYVSDSVVVDGKIVTADGPSSASEFGEKIGEVLTAEQ